MWTWDPEKDRTNVLKHGLSLSIGAKALNDPNGLSIIDPHPTEERWRTICMIEGRVLCVVHTWFDDIDGGRIIRVRKATRQERDAYGTG